IKKSVEGRAPRWKRDSSSAQKYNASVNPNREHLRRIIGATDERVKFEDMELLGDTRHPAQVAATEKFEVLAVRWPALPSVYGEGLLLRPSEAKPLADCIVVPDADQTPEMLAGIAPGISPQSQVARRLAENGLRVLVPYI